MHIEYSQRLDISLTDKRDIDAFTHILGLAIATLQTARVRQLSGSPLQSQAGIKGQDLIDTKLLIENLCKSMNLEVPTMEPSKDDPPQVHSLADLAELLSVAAILRGRTTPLASSFHFPRPGK